MNSRSTSCDPGTSPTAPAADSVPAADSAVPLTARYRRDDFLFGSGRGGLLLSPERTVQLPIAELAEQAPGLLRDHDMIAGAVPFDPAQPGHLLLGSAPLRDAGLASWPLPADEAEAAAQTLSLAAESEPQHYLAAVREALSLMKGADLQKAVLARSFQARLAGKLPLRRVLNRLVRQNQHAYVFVAPLPQGRVMVGASPELLINRTGDRVISTPLAGSLPRSFDPDVDKQRMALLRNSAKDRTEHAIVVQMVAEALTPWCRSLEVPPEPEILLTNTMIHLATRISGELRPLASSASSSDAAAELPNALQLAAALHPTPAVCGWPTGAAQHAITELEAADRGFYAGAVGWMDRSGDGEWAVTIRCAEVSNGGSAGRETVRLFAGAGIVPGSLPEAELAEVEAKLHTMLLALELNPDKLAETES
ncbi:isochorismate synthase [Acaricomes phytoseiuli]|uniref:isochorismate synthase n=1 Tax=Acaricomes phytoseiuli TaxID=291968 RepID=UPI00036E20F0|nr:isochorismate synthase [Acaricomes phytoseiuli]MCW1249444.1 isochorismate synthase [Acaricomes phytoseiuli]